MVVHTRRIGATLMLGGAPSVAHDRVRGAPSSLLPRPLPLARHATASRRSVVAIGSDAARHEGYTPARMPLTTSSPSDRHAADG
jgi:hypothetical protein